RCANARRRPSRRGRLTRSVRRHIISRDSIMKTQMTAVMTMVAALAVGAPAAALDQAAPAQTATATRAAEKAQQAAREALAAADAAQTTVWSADVQKAIAPRRRRCGRPTCSR